MNPIQSMTPLAPLRRLALGLVAAAAAVTPALAQKSDVVYRLNPRTGKTQALQGTVTSDGLDKLAITLRDGDEKSYDSLEVVQVVWGDVPQDFTDGNTYARRADWENAVKSYKAAADGSGTREPVKAAARLAAVEGMLAWGVAQPSRFSDAVAEADLFLSEFGASRHLPRVRSLKARAAWLSGDAAAARDGYRALFEAGKDGAAGYSPLDAADAALQAAHAAIAAGDTGTARELYTSAEGAFRAFQSEDPVQMLAAKEGAEVASLGESYSKVARGDFSGARGALERAVDRMETAAGKGAARLALGEALLGAGEPLAALQPLARVSALDHTDRDRRAAAMVALAKAQRAISADKGAGPAKATLDLVVAHYGDTPAAVEARSLLK